MMRTLKRPMFRMGGSANEGITSGLDKPKRGLVNEPGSYSQSLEDQFGISEIKKLVESNRPKETYKDRDDFLINLGLDMVSRSPSSNIISTIGESAKGPFKQYQAGQAQKRKTQAEGESDLFNTLIGARAKVMGSEGGSKMFSMRDKANDIESTMSTIFDLERRQAEGEDVEQELAKKRSRLQQISKADPVGQALLQQTDFVEKLMKAIQKELIAEQIDDPNNPGVKIPKYKGGKSNLELYEESIKRFKLFFKTKPKTPDGTEEKAEGGRIGYKRGMAVVQDDERTNYQNGMTAMPAAGDMMQATGDMGLQDDSAPEELTNELTFEELRQRLPQEIGDDIINLILSSAEAMEDFATIQTEDDISTFNKKYGVNLVLPSEG